MAEFDMRGAMECPAREIPLSSKQSPEAYRDTTAEKASEMLSRHLHDRLFNYTPGNPLEAIWKGWGLGHTTVQKRPSFKQESEQPASKQLERDTIEYLLNAMERNTSDHVGVTILKAPTAEMRSLLAGLYKFPTE